MTPIDEPARLAELLGGALFISQKTVQHHVTHIYAKTGISTRAAAAVFAVEHGLLEAVGSITK